MVVSSRGVTVVWTGVIAPESQRCDCSDGSIQKCDCSVNWGCGPRQPGCDCGVNWVMAPEPGV